MLLNLLMLDSRKNLWFGQIKEGEDKIEQKLDRAMINMACIHSYPTYEVEFLLQEISDHSPVIFTLFQVQDLDHSY